MKGKTFFSVLTIVVVLVFGGATATMAQGQAGTTLTATVDVTPYWTIAYDWSINKSVSPESLELNSGESGTVTYTITVTKDEGTEEAWVQGQVCVTNGGAVATVNLAITAVLQDGYEPPNDFLTSAPVDVSGNPVLDSGETGCYDYRVAIPITDGAYPQPHAEGTYKVTANVTITNHSGHLGVPFGPSPSATTVFPSVPTLINDTINVDDTNGGSWSFSESGSVTYEKTFTCDDDEGGNLNTATIRETSLYDDAIVIVTCIEIPRTGLLQIFKFYDKNANGTYDQGEDEILDWKVKVECDTSSFEGYTPLAENLPPGTYVISEFMPSETNWLATAPKSVEVDLPVTGAEVYFGNVCLGAGGGYTIGYWSNKNGQAIMNDGGTMVPELQMLKGLSLRNGSGTNFDPTTYAQFRTWLLGAKATNMAYMLSAQLAAMELNVEAGFVGGDTLVYAPGCGDYLSVNDLMSAANIALGIDGYTPSGDTNRAYQECLKNALDKANNNKNFVQDRPCPFTFPE